jgi:hypothetical protein
MAPDLFKWSPRRYTDAMAVAAGEACNPATNSQITDRQTTDARPLKTLAGDRDHPRRAQVPHTLSSVVFTPMAELESRFQFRHPFNPSPRCCFPGQYTPTRSGYGNWGGQGGGIWGWDLYPLVEPPNGDQRVRRYPDPYGPARETGDLRRQLEDDESDQMVLGAEWFPRLSHSVLSSSWYHCMAARQMGAPYYPAEVVQQIRAGGCFLRAGPTRQRG